MAEVRSHWDWRVSGVVWRGWNRETAWQGCLMRVLRWGFPEEVSCEMLALDWRLWHVTFGGSLVRNAGFGDLALHFWRKSRTKRSFCRLEELEFLRKSRAKRSFWRLDEFWKKSRTKCSFCSVSFEEVSCEGDLTNEFWKKSCVKCFWWKSHTKRSFWRCDG